MKNIKSKYILEIICDNLNEKKYMEIIKYNKDIQTRLNIELNNYKEYYEQIEIELEIIPINEDDDDLNTFIYISKEDESYYHIYFNKNKNQIKRDYCTNKDKVRNIKILIDKKVKSLYGLFQDCDCIKKINFIRFNRYNINNMNSMFLGCSSLEEINFFNFITHNVIDMGNMLSGCSALKN